MSFYRVVDLAKEELSDNGLKSPPFWNFPIIYSNLIHINVKPKYHQNHIVLKYHRNPSINTVSRVLLWIFYYFEVMFWMLLL